MFNHSTLRDPMDCNPPGTSVHGIFQARILGWVAISSSRGSSWPKDWTCISCTGRQNNGLKQHRFFNLSFSVSQESGCRLLGSSAQSLTRLKSRCQLQLWSPLKWESSSKLIQVIGKIYFLAVLGQCSEPFSCWYCWESLSDRSDLALSKQQVASSRLSGESQSSQMWWSVMYHTRQSRDWHFIIYRFHPYSGAEDNTGYTYSKVGSGGSF